MRAFTLLTTIYLIVAPMAADARVNEEGGMCWDPDVEFPVPCDEDEE